jgi:hypothetical protein
MDSIPFGSLAIAELLSSGFLVLLITSNRGPSDCFFGVFTRAFSYSLILFRGGGVTALMPFSPSVSTAAPFSLVALLGGVASRWSPPDGGSGPLCSSPE